MSSMCVQVDRTVLELYTSIDEGALFPSGPKGSFGKMYYDFMRVYPNIKMYFGCQENSQLEPIKSECEGTLWFETIGSFSTIVSEKSKKSGLAKLFLDFYTTLTDAMMYVTLGENTTSENISNFLKELITELRNRNVSNRQMHIRIKNSSELLKVDCAVRMIDEWYKQTSAVGVCLAMCNVDEFTVVVDIQNVNTK